MAKGSAGPDLQAHQVNAWLSTKVSALRESLGREKEKQQGEALLRIADSVEASAIRSNALSLKETYRLFETRRENLVANRDLTPEAKNRQLAELERNRDEAVAKVESNILDLANALVARFATKRFPAPSADLHSEMGTVFAAFRDFLPSTFLERAWTAVERAHGATSATERTERFAILRDSYEPLVQRLAVSPPDHAKLLQPVAAEVHAVMSEVLALETSSTAYAAVENYAALVRAELKAIKVVARNRWDDQLISMGSRVLFPQAA